MIIYIVFEEYIYGKLYYEHIDGHIFGFLNIYIYSNVFSKTTEEEFWRL